jgi:peptidoglycan hydrolase-like protein with peptidoglycan-binding domain
VVSPQDDRRRSGEAATGAEDTVETWAKDPAYSAAQLVSGHDGELVQIADLLFVETFHATTSNAYSVGIETKELAGGGFYEAAAHTTIAATIAGCDALGIQKQMPRLGWYRGQPIRRMINGGHDCVGVFGHRDNTDRRGRWDPGDYLFQLLAAHGFEQFDYDAGEDIATWKARQLALNQQLGTRLVVDGIPGAATRAALLAAGYKNGIWANGR